MLSHSRFVEELDNSSTDGPSSDSGSYGPLSLSPRSPDRFLSVRKAHLDTAPPFRVSKKPQLLSPNERLLRKRDPSADPFGINNTRLPSGARQTPIDRRHTPHHLPRQIYDPDLSEQRDRSTSRSRQPSAGAVWSVGGAFAATGARPRGPLPPVSDGQGGLIGRGTSAPLYEAKFFPTETQSQKLESHESRLAVALKIDQAARILNVCNTSPVSSPVSSPGANCYIDCAPFPWDDVKSPKHFKGTSKPDRRPVPSTPFRVLDAPFLRDDFYCSTLAYCYTAKKLAVGLGNRVYLWSEHSNVQYPPFPKYRRSNYVVSLAFSSKQGGNSILAVGRQSGQVSLWSTFDKDVRFEVHQPNPVSCVAFKQTTKRRPSERFQGLIVYTEDLVVGDDAGNIWYYSVEWTDPASRERHGCNGSVVLLAKIAAHSQQICGLAFSPDGCYLASGGNDNTCLLFDIRSILVNDNVNQSIDCVKDYDQPSSRTAPSKISRFLWHQNPNHLAPTPTVSGDTTRRCIRALTRSRFTLPGPPRTAYLPANSYKHKFHHCAAVKAMAFAPWQPSLLATGGGSNDRCIRFFHTPSGACLATINVHAQVTSLIWSKTRREIAATFGYAQPEHPFRIAVFEWPSCQQVVAIPWGSSADGSNHDNGLDCGRALWAISYPGGPNDVTDEESRSGRDASLSSSEATRSMTSSPTSFDSGNESRTSSEPSSRSSRSANSEGGTWWSRTVEEGCIVVASSDECVKFHEVWSGRRKNAFGSPGLFGGSRLLETLEGIEKDGSEIIR